MTAEDFRAAIARLGYGQRSFAEYMSAPTNGRCGAGRGGAGYTALGARDDRIDGAGASLGDRCRVNHGAGGELRGFNPRRPPAAEFRPTV